jgi:hypothetical protein
MHQLHCVFCKSADLAPFSAADTHPNLPPYLAAGALACANCSQRVCVVLSTEPFVATGAETPVLNNSTCPLCATAPLVNICDRERVQRAFPHASSSSMQACMPCAAQMQTVPLVSQKWMTA